MGLAYPHTRRLNSGGPCGRNLNGSTERKAEQQRTVECGEQDEAHRTSWSSTASVSIPSRLESILPLGIDGLRRESEVDAAQLFIT